jgi:hypothetical protein
MLACQLYAVKCWFHGFAFVMLTLVLFSAKTGVCGFLSEILLTCGLAETFNQS